MNCRMRKVVALHLANLLGRDWSLSLGGVQAALEEMENLFLEGARNVGSFQREREREQFITGLHPVCSTFQGLGHA